MSLVVGTSSWREQFIEAVTVSAGSLAAYRNVLSFDYFVFFISHYRPKYSYFKRVFTTRRYAVWYMLSSCVYPSLCLSAKASIVSKHLDESSWFLAWRLCYKEIRVSPKLGYFPLNFIPNSVGLRKFRHGKSIMSTKLVVVVVDGRVC